MAAKSQARKTKEKHEKFSEHTEKIQNENLVEESGDEESGVDEESLEKLMNALGENDLDDIAKMQLDILGSNINGEDESGSDEEDEDDEDDNGEIDRSRVENEDSNNDEDDQSNKNLSSKMQTATDVNDDEDRDEEEVALDDVDSVDEDAVPRQKLQIDNKVALERIRETIQLDPKLPWTETLVVTYPETISVDVDDDLNRELAFYKQALDGAKKAQALARKHGLLFTRPPDYFAEMVKSDSHMERIRERLLDEKASIKKSEDRRKEKEGKKFGKQIQLEKLKERERSKKDMTQKLKDLKRKRKDVLDEPNGNDDAFDVAVEDAISDKPSKRPRNGKSMPRNARDSKFGFGGRGRRTKQNTRSSTEQFDFGSGKGIRGGKGGRGGRDGRDGRSTRGSSRRLGKSRRMAGRGK